ncbi:MAG: Fis family transcriptional regulator [Cyanobacteria bacterium P01_G01_bin.54]
MKFRAHQPEAAAPLFEVTHPPEIGSDLEPVDDRFELLSAYLDGEVTLGERQQVQQWLDQDTEVQQLHQSLLRLHQRVQATPAPEPSCDPEVLIAGVFAAETRRRQRHWLLWGGSAIAAAAMATVSLLFGSGLLSPRLAQSPEPEHEKLMIAVNQPAVDIPTIADSTTKPGLLIPLNRPVVDIPVVDQ